MMRVTYSLGTICLSIVHSCVWSFGVAFDLVWPHLPQKVDPFSLQGKRTVKIDSVW